MQRNVDVSQAQAPVESVSLTFGRISATYNVYDSYGKPTGAATKTWDVATGRSY